MNGEKPVVSTLLFVPVPLEFFRIWNAWLLWKPPADGLMLVNNSKPVSLFQRSQLMMSLVWGFAKSKSTQIVAMPKGAAVGSLFQSKRAKTFTVEISPV